MSLRVPWLRRGVSFRTPGEWIGHFKASKRARILVRSSAFVIGFVPHSWVFRGRDVGFLFWVWGTLVEWDFVLQGLFMGTVGFGVWFGLELGFGFYFFYLRGFALLVIFGISHRAWWRTPRKNYSCAERSNPDS